MNRTPPVVNMDSSNLNLFEDSNQLKESVVYNQNIEIDQMNNSVRPPAYLDDDVQGTVCKHHLD
jgi:hypothetical protein